MKLTNILLIAFSMLVLNGLTSQSQYEYEIGLSRGLFYFSDFDDAYMGSHIEIKKQMTSESKFGLNIGYGEGLGVDLIGEYYFNASLNYYLKPWKISQISSFNSAVGLSYLNKRSTFDYYPEVPLTSIQVPYRGVHYKYLFGINVELDYNVQIRDYFSLGIGGFMQPLLGSNKMNNFITDEYQKKLFGGLYLKVTTQF